MKPFDLEAAKAGAPVCTRGGNEARIVCFNRVDLEYPILGLRKNKAGGEYIFSYTLDGFAFLEDIGGEEDLMMRDDDYAEKLARGEYGHHIEDKLEKIDPTVKENLTVDTPTCKESLPVDREYWLRVYAGQIMPVVFHAAITTGAKVKDEYKDMPADVAVARSAIILADALIAELEKKEIDG